MRDAQEIKELKAVLSRDAQLIALHTAQEEALKLYNLEFLIRVGKDATEIKPGKSRSKVDYAVDHLITDKPVVTCTRPKKSQKAQEAADKTEEFGQRFLFHLDRTSLEPLNRTLVKDGIIYGMGVRFGPLFLPEVFPKKPIREKGERREKYTGRLTTWEGQVSESFPFLVRAICPINFYANFGDRQPEYGLEIGKRTVADVKKLLAEIEVKWEKDGQPGDLVDWATFSSAEELAYIVDNEVVYLKPNPYGFCLHHVITAGFGNNSPDASPEQRFRGLLYGSKASFKGQAEVLSAIVEQTKVNAYGRHWTDEDLTKVQFGGLGHITHFPAGSKGPQVWPNAGTPVDSWRLLQYFDNLIDEETYARQLQGIFPSGDTSGYRERLAIGKSETKFHVLLTQVGRGTSDLLRKAVWIAKNVIKEPLFEEGFKPEELLENPNFTVELQASDPQDQYMRIDTGLKLLNAGAISLREFKEKYEQNPNATEAIVEILAEKGAFAPQNIGGLAEAAAQDWGMKTAEEELKTRAKEVLPQPGGLPGEAPPPEPSQPGSPEQMELMQRRFGNQGMPISQRPRGL